MLRSYLYYDRRMSEYDVSTLPSLKYLNKKQARLWVIAKNPTKDELELLQNKLLFHPTTTEDMTSSQSRLKYEEFDTNTFIVFKGLTQNGGQNMDTYTLFFVDGERYLVTAYYDDNDTIDTLYSNPKKVLPLLKKGEDFVLHYIFDKEIDKYLELKSRLAEKLRLTEEEFIRGPSKDLLQHLYEQEREMLEMRQSVDLLIDVCQKLMKPTDNFIHNELIPYFRDIYDHIHRVGESIKTYLDRITGIRNSYLSLTSHRMNESMQLLTIVMTVMMPLSVITGFYGMNITLPIQSHPLAYLIIILIMLALVVAMLLFFRKQGLIVIDH